ncbi:MAG TPA: hypothetical protein V6D22_21235 [Candidatus Obscuribacterales bacterium]
MNELVSVAILAHRNDRHEDAIELLLQIVQNERENWLAWFYLAMSYGKVGKMAHAHRIFRVVRESCPDESLRMKAQLAVPALEAEMRERVASQETKKPANITPLQLRAII